MRQQWRAEHEDDFGKGADHEASKQRTSLGVAVIGVFAGIAANVATGAILQKTGAFDLVFVVTALVYLSSGLVWEKNMRGKPLFP